MQVSQTLTVLEVGPRLGLLGGLCCCEWRRKLSELVRHWCSPPVSLLNRDPPLRRVAAAHRPWPSTSSTSPTPSKKQTNSYHHWWHFYKYKWCGNSFPPYRRCSEVGLACENIAEMIFIIILLFKACDKCRWHSIVAGCEFMLCISNTIGSPLLSLPHNSPSDLPKCHYSRPDKLVTTGDILNILNIIY